MHCDKSFTEVDLSDLSLQVGTMYKRPGPFGIENDAFKNDNSKLVA